MSATTKDRRPKITNQKLKNGAQTTNHMMYKGIIAIDMHSRYLQCQFQEQNGYCRVSEGREARIAQLLLPLYGARTTVQLM